QWHKGYQPAVRLRTTTGGNLRQSNRAPIRSLHEDLLVYTGEDPQWYRAACLLPVDPGTRCSRLSEWCGQGSTIHQRATGIWDRRPDELRIERNPRIELT